MSKEDAEEKMIQVTKQDPENTLCENTYWFLKGGYSVKCTRNRYTGIDCGAGYREMYWDRQYKYIKQLASDLKKNKK